MMSMRNSGQERGSVTQSSIGFVDPKLLLRNWCLICLEATAYTQLTYLYLWRLSPGRGWVTNWIAHVPCRGPPARTRLILSRSPFSIMRNWRLTINPKVLKAFIECRCPRWSVHPQDGLLWTSCTIALVRRRQRRSCAVRTHSLCVGFGLWSLRCPGGMRWTRRDSSTSGGWNDFLWLLILNYTNSTNLNSVAFWLASRQSVYQSRITIGETLVLDMVWYNWGKIDTAEESQYYYVVSFLWKLLEWHSIRMLSG